MKEDGGELLDEGGLEAEDVEEKDVSSRRGPRRGLRRIGEDARRGKGRMRRKASEGLHIVHSTTRLLMSDGSWARGERHPVRVRSEEEDEEVEEEGVKEEELEETMTPRTRPTCRKQ